MSGSNLINPIRIAQRGMPTLRELFPEHKADLETSGISLDYARDAGIKTIPPHFVHEYLARCGWRITEGEARTLLLFPYQDHSGNSSSHFRLKVFPPLTDHHGSRVKYLSPKNIPSRIYIPPGVDPHGQDCIYITEGEKKALKLTQEGFPCLGLGGVWGWRGGRGKDGTPLVNLDMEEVNWQRDIVIVFDADRVINPNVQKAETALAEELISRGAKVYFKRLPFGPDKPKGADDFIVKHGVDKFGELPFLEYKKSKTLEEALKYEIMPFTSFAEIKLPLIKYLLDPWLAESSLTLISSAPGVGKTFLAMEIAAAVANPRYAMDDRWTTDYYFPTLFIDGEMTLQEIQERGKMLGLGKCEILSKAKLDQNDTTLNLAVEGDRNLLLNYILERGFKLVILDNIYSLFVGLDTNLAKDWDAPNQWLLKLKAKGVATILLHHTGKDENKQLGTAAREFNINTALILKDARDSSNDENCAFTIQVKKQRARGLRLENLKYQCVDGNWTVTDIVDKDDQRARVARLLADGEKTDAIAKVLGKSAGWISKIRKGLVEDGLLEEQGQSRNKKASLTPKGEAWISNLHGRGD